MIKGVLGMAPDMSSECQSLNTFELHCIVVCLPGPDPYTTAVG